MGITEYYYLVAGLGASILAAVVFAMVTYGRPEFRIARWCAWGAALLFMSISVVWGTTTPEPFWVRASAVGVTAVIVAVGLVETLRFVSKKENEVVITETTKTRPPTLEATDKGKIDATDGTIPGDLPFPFAKASRGGIVNMPGITVTTENGVTTVRPGHANLRFPAPTGEFSELSNIQLKHRAEKMASELRVFHNGHKIDFPSPLDDDQLLEIMQKTARLFEDKYVDINLSLASEMMARIGVFEDSELPESARTGTALVLNKAYAGPQPAVDAAAFLEALAAKLPEESKDP